MKKYNTHRCEGSLKNEVSIRFYGEFEGWNIPDYRAWRLFKSIYDRDYNEPHLKHICELNLCPFCGEDLQEVNCKDCFNYNGSDGVDYSSICND